MTHPDANRIAKRLGLPQEAMRKLQRHGLLQRLDLDEHELRRRLWRGHLAHLRRAASVQGSRDSQPRGEGDEPRYGFARTSAWSVSGAVERTVTRHHPD